LQDEGSQFKLELGQIKSDQFAVREKSSAKVWLFPDDGNALP
jgi:hypothetical protein